MKIWEAAIAVLQETDNPAVMWGDVGLLHSIAERAGLQIPVTTKLFVTEQRVLNALTRTPGRLQATYTTTGRGRRVRIFRLSDEDLLLCKKPISADASS